jgi:hypothetical protein
MAIGTSFYLIPRIEKDIWNRLVAIHPSRIPNFGDYTIVYPILPDIEFNFRIAPKVKYAADTNWLAVRTEKNQSFQQVCQILTTRPEYRGPNFSWGDRRIHECLTGHTEAKAPVEWTAIGINHHLTTVATEIANQPGL